MLKLINGFLGALCFVILGSDVLAATHDRQLRREVTIQLADGVDLSEAVSIAETRVAGRAVNAQLVSFAGRDSWDVDVVRGDQKIRVWVDAVNGAVTVTTPSQGER